MINREIYARMHNFCYGEHEPNETRIQTLVKIVEDAIKNSKRVTRAITIDEESVDKVLQWKEGYRRGYQDALSEVEAYQSRYLLPPLRLIEEDNEHIQQGDSEPDIREVREGGFLRRLFRKSPLRDSDKW